MLLLLVCAPFLGALIIATLGPRWRLPPAWIAGLTAALGLALVLTQAPAVYQGELLLDRREWVPEIGLSLAFRLDGLSLLFAELILLAGVAIGGKQGFGYIKAKVFGIFKAYAPPQTVSPMRYTIGLVIFWLPQLFAMVSP